MGGELSESLQEFELIYSLMLISYKTMVNTPSLHVVLLKTWQCRGTIVTELRGQDLPTHLFSQPAMFEVMGLDLTVLLMHLSIIGEKAE